MKYSGVEWLGKIPHDWEVLKAKRIFKLKNEKNSELKPLLSVSKGRGLLLREEMVNRPTHAQKNIEAFKLVGDGDFVIHLRSFQSGFELSSIEGAVSPAYTVFNARKNDEVCNEYYKYIFYSKPFIDKIASTTLSLRDGKPISYDDFSITLLPVPNYIEQQKIAAFLDEKVSHIDKIVEDTKKSIENLKAYKRSLITETVTKGMDLNVKMKDSGIKEVGEIPEHWDIEKLKFHSIIDPSHKENDSLPEKAQFVPMDNVKDGYLRLSEVGNTNNLVGKYTYFRDGDIVIAKVRPSFENGNIAIASNLENKIGFGTTEIFTLRVVSNKVITEFLFYYLRNSNFLNVASSTMTGVAGLKRISSSFLMNYKIVIPVVEEQSRIVRYLDEKLNEINSLLRRKEQLITELEAYKKSLIYEYVTGKKEVK